MALLCFLFLVAEVIFSHMLLSIRVLYFIVSRFLADKIYYPEKGHCPSFVCLWD